jgi:hypothetical protein
MGMDLMMVESLVHFPPLVAGDLGNLDMTMMLTHIDLVITHNTQITTTIIIIITISMYLENSTALVHMY